MTQQRPFQLLLKVFQDRFFESEDVAPGSGFQTNINQVLGFLLTMGFGISYVMIPVASRMMSHDSGQLNWVIRGLQLFPPAYTFAVIAFAAFFEWDMLFPNRRDFLILAPFPVTLPTLFLAQFAALGRFLGILIFGINIFPTLFMALLSLQFRGAGLRLIGGQLAATVGVSLFAFVSVAALQGLLITFTSPRAFRRISPYVQMCGMSLTILSLLTFPIYFRLLRHAIEGRELWLWLFPPVWFTGLYDHFFPNPHGLFAELGTHALRVFAATIAVFALTWIAGFRRHYRRTLEADDTRPRVRSGGIPAPWMSSPEERAIYRFSGKTLARSRKHQLFLVTYLSVGLSLAVNSALDVDEGRIVLSEAGARVCPFIIVFCVISAIRAGFQFPAELPANWLFRITETGWAEIARAVTRSRVAIAGLIPVLLLLAPAETAVWSFGRVPLFVLFQFTIGALLIEAMFWTFDKVPFTCSYFPGRTNLAILFMLYFYGFTNYSVQMAKLQFHIEHNAVHAAVFFAAAASLLAIAWRRRPAGEAVRFDAGEPVIQTLDLS